MTPPPAPFDLLEQLARATVQHLSRADVLLVASVATQQTERFTALLNAQKPDICSAADFAALVLRIAKQIKSDSQPS